MIDRILIDNLNLGARDFAVRYKDQVRKNPQLTHFNTFDDDTLIEFNMKYYPLLARMLDRGLDRTQMGEFFVAMGKERMRLGFPMSEVIFALSIIQDGVIEYIMTEFAPENPMRMYQSMGVLTKVADFFLMGSFYITKGFLEETYTSMYKDDEVSNDLLNKYFKDDFFFKD